MSNSVNQDSVSTDTSATSGADQAVAGQAVAEQVMDFVTRGLLVLGPEALGIDASVHEAIYTEEKHLFRAKEAIDAGRIPAILQVLQAPGLVAACNGLLGEDWAIVPYSHNTPFISGAYDQHWHKDDNGPYNQRKPRYHQPIQVEMLYYPQAVAADMGPTATLPYSQYWTLNSEENQDNFAGADHLDFNYQIEGLETQPVSGKRSIYSAEDVRTANTAHDHRMRQVVQDLDWPLVQPFEAGPLAAGSVVLYSHNLFHRGNHRRDDWTTWRDNPRFMWRFWLYRTTEPQTQATSPGWVVPPRDALTGMPRERASAGMQAIWRQQYRWLGGRFREALGEAEANLGQLDELAAALLQTGERNEPGRVNAAYQLAQECSDQHAAKVLALLRGALHHERESVRRAATFGLVAIGDQAQTIFLEAAQSPRRWVRKAGVYGLGAACELTQEAFGAIAQALTTDNSVYLRSVAADALGHLARRGASRLQDATEDANKTFLLRMVSASLDLLVASLGVEENRLSMDRAQQRSIKFVRPTDECDVCEGIGIDYGIPRFEPVRSAVRENTLTSIVVLAAQEITFSQGCLRAAAERLRTIVETDTNIFSVGLALDAAARFRRSQTAGGHLFADIESLGLALDLVPWESLVRSNITP